MADIMYVLSREAEYRDGSRYTHARSMAARMRLVAYYADDLVCTCRLAHVAEIQHGIPFRRDLGDHHAGIGPK